MKKSAVVIVSGGLDSTVLLHFVAKCFPFDVYALSFNYGQRHSKELECAKYQANCVGCKEHKIVDISSIKELLSSSALIDVSKDIPSQEYSVEVARHTYVPNRNMIMLSIAVAYAENIGAKHVFYGAHLTDAESVYLDCRFNFVKAVSEASSLATYNQVRIIAPFATFRKEDIILLGAGLGVDFSKTWSCYRGGDVPCKTCATCLERKKAFENCGLQDPLS